MKLTPQSMALWSAASDSESSTGPHALPMAHAPKLISEIFQGVRPNDRYFMDSLLMMLSDFHRGDAETRRKTEEPESHAPLVPRATCYSVVLDSMIISSVRSFLLSYPFPEPVRLPFYGGERTILKRDEIGRAHV